MLHLTEAGDVEEDDFVSPLVVISLGETDRLAEIADGPLAPFASFAGLADVVLFTGKAARSDGEVTLIILGGG